MTKPTKFSATYSDWKLIKTRGVVQVVFEVPLHMESVAYEVLGGMPSSGDETWYEIEKLKGEKEVASEPLESSRPSPQLPPAARANHLQERDRVAVQRAGILCHEEGFWSFLNDTRIAKRIVKSEDSAASAVREFLGLKSRNEIQYDNLKWVELMARFEAWKRMPSVVA